MERLLPFRFVRAKRAHAGSGKQKSRRRCPCELRHALHRRLLPAATASSEPGVTSGRDSRETQSVSGRLQVVKSCG